MLVVETIAKIRRLFFHQQKPIKAISRELKISRRAVRKAIRSEVTEFRYERSVQAMPKLGAWREQLDGLLAANEGKPAGERPTLIRVFETLRDLGFDGGYDAVRRYAKSWRKARGAAAAQAYIPLSFSPGEAYQFDWSHEVVLIEGVTIKVKMAHLRLCHSRMLFVRAYPRESQEMVFDAHDCQTARNVDPQLECAPAGGQIGFWQLTAFRFFGKRTHGEAPQSQHRIQTSDRAGVHRRRDAARPGEAA